MRVAKLKIVIQFSDFKGFNEPAKLEPSAFSFEP
jgi:hypothetical protein